MDIEDIGSSTVSKTGKYDQHVKSSMPFDVRVRSFLQPSVPQREGEQESQFTKFCFD